MPQVSHLPNFDTVTHKLQATFGAIKSTANFSIYLLFADYVCPFPGHLASKNFTRKKDDKVGNKNCYTTSLMFIIIPGLNVKIIAFEVANYAVAKKKPEKIQACLDSRSNPELCDTVAGL